MAEDDTGENPGEAVEEVQTAEPEVNEKDSRTDGVREPLAKSDTIC